MQKDDDARTELRKQFRGFVSPTKDPESDQQWLFGELGHLKAVRNQSERSEYSAIRNPQTSFYLNLSHTPMKWVIQESLREPNLRRNEEGRSQPGSWQPESESRAIPQPHLLMAIPNPFNHLPPPTASFSRSTPIFTLLLS